MPGKIYAQRNGEWVQINADEVKPAETPFVHQDTMPPLKNPVTGNIHDSKSNYVKECNRNGLVIVGDDLLSKYKHTPKQYLTDEKILDAAEKAESILRDPTKRREYENKRLAELELRRKLVG